MVLSMERTHGDKVQTPDRLDLNLGPYCCEALTTVPFFSYFAKPH